ncbi:GNAT family N-acetyltransferase [Paractinoplanes brasiliensis]|uniref:Putative acetyltransferase n=1 Tax=Paractinoplanes brasiliensis TaxID=52695 RepID=A0A4R6JZF6_9ACTN|nr:N-acetyltransferase [Actinoplanes brasiliensis]TDO41807.1 putative acetyltransferase [Actinoplanes brasiliensis]
MIRRERSADVPAIHAITAAAFRDAPYSAPPVEPGGDPGEATLVSWLRADAGWIPELSFVAVEDDQVIGHVVATRAHVEGRPVLGLGPLSVLPRRQRAGVGTALMHAVLGAAEALGEPLVGLLGNPSYYGRFGFVAAEAVGIVAPEPGWGENFQVRTLSQYEGQAGRFAYAEPFGRL